MKDPILNFSTIYPFFVQGGGGEIHKVHICFTTELFLNRGGILLDTIEVVFKETPNLKRNVLTLRVSTTPIKKAVV